MCVLFGDRSALGVSVRVTQLSVPSTWRSRPATGAQSLYFLPLGCLNSLLFTGEVRDKPPVCRVHWRCVCAPEVCSWRGVWLSVWFTGVCEAALGQVAIS